MEYRPELDGIRAYGMLAVLAFHAYLAFSTGTWMAVDTFFVLSGYLITTIVLTEHRRKGAVALGRFYFRRLMRLYPALLAMLVLSLFFYRDIGADGSLRGFAQTAAAAGLYLQDLVWGLAGKENGHLGHTWSLAVEMQFYLVWPPLLVWLVARRQKLLPWILALALVCFTLLTLQSGAPVQPKAFAPGYYLPWTRSFELFLGCAVAVWAIDKPAPDLTVTPKRRYVGWLIAAGMGFMILVGDAFSILKTPSVMIWQAPIVALLTVALIVHLNRVRGRGVGRVLAWKPVVWLGQRSYAVYLFHYPVIHVLRERYGVADASNMYLIAGAISIILAAISWSLLEHPAQEWGRRRIAARPVAAAAAPS